MINWFKRKKKQEEEVPQQANARDIADIYLTRTAGDKNNLECLVALLELHDVETETLGFEPKVQPSIRGEHREVLIKKVVEIVKTM